MSTRFVEINGQVFDYESLTLPASGREFRNAWDIPVGGVIQINLAKAKEIKEEQLRTELFERDRKLGGSYRSIPAKEKSLINPQGKLKSPRVDTATTPEELEAITLDSLLV